MSYKDIFAVDEISYAVRKENNEDSPSFYFKNFVYYEPKLVEVFYLNYFLREFLFDVKISELNDFVNFQYDKSQAPDEFLQVLDFEVLPAIEDIIENIHLSMNGGGYYNQIILEDGFVETEGVIKNSQYELTHFSHLIACKKNKSQILKRKDILINFLTEVNRTHDNSFLSPLKWIAGPSQLAIIIRELIDQGYMEAEEKKGEVNNAKLARDLFQAFSIKECNSPKSLEIYLSPGNKRYSQAKEEFDKRDFLIPPAKFT